jgi:hypothetical protein
MLDIKGGRGKTPRPFFLLAACPTKAGSHAPYRKQHKEEGSFQKNKSHEFPVCIFFILLYIFSVSSTF